MPTALAATIVFVASAAVLVLEILAGRLLAPYVGITLESFTAIIGTVLAGIATGNWLGGRLADRYEPRSLLGPMLVLGGALAFLTIPVVDGLAAGARVADPGTIVLLAASGFFAPAMVLSGVTPTVVKIQLGSLEETGRVVGRLSAIATAGAIAGTFVTGFVLVAAFPTRATIRLLAAGLALGGVLLWLRLRRWRELTVGGLVAVLVAGGLSFAAADPCQYESAYFCARVVTDPDRASGRTLWLDTVRHSYVDLEDPTHLGFTYSQTMSDVLATVAPPGAPLDVVHVGGGGFTLPRYLRATRPGSDHIVLELDPLLVEIGQDQLGLELRDDIEVRTGDARLTLRDVPDGSADVVVGDAFGGVAVPWHLTTQEFLWEVRRVLTSGGVYVMNLIDHEPLAFARAEVATLRTVFEHVAVLAPPARLRGEEGGNFVIVASDGELDVAAMLARNEARGDDEAALVDEELEAFVDGAQVLTDEHAPVDQLLTPYGP
ncbi:MAG: fused MFS/spermidine synthase [Nitriliruptorales bacterium]|nr:fused MFS/spermidine synthase [Nitriliruptorales bacterium]